MSDDRSIAVIGMGLRAPGAANTEEFWQSLIQGKESISRLSDDDVIAAHGDPAVLSNPDLVRAAGILDGIEKFDAAYFGYTPREAEIMDPQQRFLLEVAVEALEDAGCDPTSSKSTTGVFLGIGRSGYFLHHLLPRTDLMTLFARQISLFNDKDFAATQISHRLNLTGPSMTIGTACSTSLVSVHQACKSLLEFECDVALAGGATINVLQHGGYQYQEGNIFSPDGHCRAFDAEAHGTVGGSGVGLVVLKRLSDAVRDGDAIRAVIRGSAVNNDGADKVGFTAPSVAGQASVVFEAQQVAGVDAESIGYVEAHGTGTPLGDPIEVSALTEAFRMSTDERGFCALGSVKTNVGHLDTAAGVAGFIKAVLAVERGVIPPSLHFRRPNPEIDFESSPFFVNAELREWSGPSPRRAGVSSFGMGGTNAHVILEQPPAVEPDAGSVADWDVLVTSGKSVDVVSRQRARLGGYLTEYAGRGLSDVAFTLQTGREHHEFRAAVVARSGEDAGRALAGGAGLVSGRALADARVAFLFAGQGSQFMGMGRELFERERVFREVFEECAGVVGAELGEDLGGLLFGDAGELAVSRLGGTRLQQPALFAVQYAMAEQWRAWGVEPCVMLGHSLGEYVAATVAGVWSLGDAVRLVCARGDLMQRQSPGAMLAVSLGEGEARQVAEAAGCVIAAVNSPAQSVLSGPVEAVERAERVVAERQVRHRRLATSHAFHSPMMEPMLKDFERLVSGVEARAPKVPFVSNVTGDWITPEQATSPSYWAEHVRSTVRFSPGAKLLLRDEPDALLVEAGPGTTASVLLADHEQARGRVMLSSMGHARDTRGDVQVTREALAELWVNGVSVNWPALHEHRSPRRVPLPTYPFETKRHWIERKTADAATHAARLFQPVFRRAPLPAADPGTQDERWLVFADRLGIADRWTARLRGLGERVVTVETGTSYERPGEDAYRVRPQTPEDFDRLVRELQEAHGPGGTWNVLYLWAADTEADVDRARVLALDAPVHFARALGLHRAAAPTRLAVITQGLAQVEGGETAPPTRALVLGPVKTLPLEYPALAASAIDIEDAEAELDPLISEIRASLPRPFVAYRGTTRFAEDVEAMTTADASSGSMSLRPQGVYLITGGLGGLGRAIAAWMARTYQARLVLLGRTPLPSRERWTVLESDPGTDAETRSRIAAVRELESHGAQVHVDACDVTDRVALAEAVDRAELRFGPVEGVVHAAGLAGGGLAQFRSVEAMREVLAPKVDGTLALASVLDDRQLDFFAVFSSTGALLGSLGQVDYCAANAFLDAWAESSDAPARAVAIAWDAWRNVGMAAKRLPAAEAEAHTDHESSGVSASDALSVFERALFGGRPRVIVSTKNLPDRLDRATKRHQDQPEAPSGPAERSRTETESVLTAIWKDLFGRAHIERDANFFELGGDSLLIIEAGRQIKQRLEVSLAVADLFKFPTIARLAEHLAPASSAQDSEAPSTTVRPAAESSDIAVIGMAARFPGAKNVDEFWENLVAGVESLVPTDEPAKEGADGQGQYVPVAGTADGVDQFDPTLFGYTAREAEIMDPQQRLLLMCAYEALEDAGHAPRGQSGKVAVYAGVAMSSYLLNNLIPRRDSSNIDPMAVSLGNDKDFAATQISYRLNLNGPSVSVGTACSTSLVAIAHACRSLISGESDMALAGGAKVRVPEHSGYWFHDGGILSPDGHCRAFDADGQGTVFSSGGGVVVLKRLSDAVRDGDAIRAVIRGSAVNNDGADKVGFTAPSVAGQASVVFEAQQVAGVDAESIGYVEAHGTGTPLGDPIEVSALTEAFRMSTDERGFCALGSVKTNVGHLDTAAGVAGFIKAVLAVERGVIPPSLHFRRPNPEIDFESSPFFVNAELREWSGPSPRRAGVSSFGMGGTNAHVILEQPPAVEPDAGSVADWDVLVTSGKSVDVVSRQRARLGGYLTEYAGRGLSDVAFTLQTGREHHEFRAAVVARSGEDAGRALAGGAGLVSGRALADARVAFLFAGQGSQFMGMGRELFERERVFREVFEECAGVVGAELGEDLGGLLFGDAGELAVSRLGGTRLQQPALFAVQYAMAEQWRAWGVEPCVMLGHSLGEYVAATVAGVWSLGDAVRLVCARGDLMQRQSPGAMLAVSLGEGEARQVAEAAGCVIAAVNSPAQSVLSGPVEAVERAERVVAERQVRHRRLATSHAFHSPMMEPMLKDFERLVSGVEARAPKVPFVSNVTGDWITPEQATSPSYWAEHVRSTVRFSAGVDRLLSDDPGALLLEVGPGTAANTMVGDHQQARDRVLITSLRHARDTRDDLQVTREALAELWVNGVSVNWPALHEHRSPRRVPLPTYPFETKRYWVERKGAGPAACGARLFRPAFRRLPLAPADTGTPGVRDERWLVFADRLGIADRWTARLRGLGERVVTVETGTSYERPGEDAYRVRPQTPEDFDRLVRELQEAHGPGGTWNVLYLWAADTDIDVDRAGAVALEAPVHFARALGLHRGTAPTRLAVVTQGLARVGGTETQSPARALALGPVKTLPLEYPALSASVIDIEDAVAEFEQVVAELRASLPRSFVACRGATRFVEDVETLAADGADAGGGPRGLRPGGVYVITGGLGGVGRAVAVWMARTYQARLVLVGRTPLPERDDWAALESEPGTDTETRERMGAVRELESSGAQVLVEACDVADRAALAEAVARAELRFGPIQGVVHAAGLAGGGLAQFRDVEAMREVLAPKVNGTLALASVFGGRQLDFFAVFSSTAALLGNLGQVDYCAANAFLDAWADSPDAPGHVVSVAWDVWRDVGMAAAERLPSVLREAHAGHVQSGVSAAEALSVLERALFAGERRVVVSTENLPDRLERGARRHQRQTEEEPGDGGKRSQAETESVLTAIWKDLFGRAHIERDANFFELGGDSLLFVEAGWQIRKQLQVSLTVADLFKFPTIALLTEHLAPASSTQEAAASPTTNRHTADVQEQETALIPLKAGDGHGTPLFLVHPAGGSVFFYRELADLLPADATVYGFQARGIERDAEPRRSVEEMASCYLEELRAAHPRGPYALGGASFGGLVALEMAQRLRADGETVELLVVFDSPGPGQVPPDLGDVDITEFSSIAPDPAFARQLAEVYRANMEALRAYRPRPYPGPVLYFLAEQRREGIDPLRPDLAWEPLAPGGLTVHRVPGDHVTMLAAQNVPAISRVVSAHLESAEAKKR